MSPSFQLFFPPFLLNDAEKIQKEGLSSGYKCVFNSAQKNFADEVTDVSSIQADTRKIIIEFNVTLPSARTAAMWALLEGQRLHRQAVNS